MKWLCWGKVAKLVLFVLCFTLHCTEKPLPEKREQCSEACRWHTDTVQPQHALPLAVCGSQAPAPQFLSSAKVARAPVLLPLLWLVDLVWASRGEERGASEHAACLILVSLSQKVKC